MIAAGSVRSAFAALIALAVVVPACRHDGPSGPSVMATSLSAETSVAIAAPVGTVIPIGATVVVRDQDGRPFSGATVTFTPAPGAGTVEIPTVRTDSRGLASSGKWTLGKASGSQRLIARVARLDSVAFVASAAPGAPTALVAAMLAKTSATVATTLPTPPAVILRDQYANPIAGVPVEFAVRSGGGTATGTMTVTNQHGVATVGSWTLGTGAGPQALGASAASLPELLLPVTVLAGPAEVLRLVSGSDGITQVGRSLSVTPRVSARDAYANPVAGRPLKLRVAQGGGTIRGDVITSDAGIASLESWTMGPSEGLNAVTVELDGLPALTIYAKAVPVSSFDIEFRYLGAVTELQRLAFERAAARWEKVIIGDLPAITSSQSGYCGVNGTALNQVVDDLIIFVELVAIDGPGKVLGSAGPCSVRSASGLPHVGAMRFDIDDVIELEATDRFDNVVLHEIGHILGMGTLWESATVLVGAGGADPYFTGVSGRAAFALAGGAAFRGTPVPVENSGGPGTRDGHWRESVLNAEVMTGFVEAAGVRMPLSLVTVGALEDLGYQITAWGDDAYTYFGLGNAAGISASRARSSAPDRELIEVPFPPPTVATAAGDTSPISARTTRPEARTRRVTQVRPQPVQELEVRRPR